MIQIRIVSVAIAAGLISGSALFLAGSASAMSEYRWKNRPLLVFAPASGGKSLSRQLAIVRARVEGFRDRDMVVVVVQGSRISMALGRPQRLGAAALRRRYGVGPASFRTILIGKDGGAKLSSSVPISAARLFGLIDAMPMRRQEMRRNGR